MSSRDPKSWMWADACELLERAERIQRQFFQLGLSGAGRPTWQPPVDVYETEADLLIMIALPGVTAEKLRVGVQEDGILVVSGERMLPIEARGGSILRLEIPHGYFERRIELPRGHFRLQRQELTDGCLLLSLRKLA